MDEAQVKLPTLRLLILVAVLCNAAGTMGNCLEKIAKPRDAVPFEAVTCYPAADYTDHRGLWNKYLEDARFYCVRRWSRRADLPDNGVATFQKIHVLKDAGMSNERAVDCACVTEVWADKSCYMEYQRSERSWYKGAVKQDGTHCMFGEVLQRQKPPSAAASGEWHQQCSGFDTPYLPFGSMVAGAKETLSDVGKSMKSAADSLLKKVKGGSTGTKDGGRGNQDDDSRDSFDDSRSEF